MIASRKPNETKQSPKGNKAPQQYRAVLYFDAKETLNKALLN